MKIGILSLAHHHAESYLQNLLNIPGVELLGVADDDPQRGELFARQANSRYFPSYEALLAEKPAGVLICSENAHHHRLVMLAAQAGVSALCEKPLATTLADAEDMVRACKEAGITLMTAFPMRYSAPMVEIKQLVADGGLGTLYAGTGRNQGQVPVHLRGWFVDPQLAGGGAVFDHTVHLADVLRWYTGSEVSEVYARDNRIIRGGEVSVETGGLVMLRFASGFFATIDCSWSRPALYPTWGGLNLELVGEKGVVRVDGFGQNLEVFGQPAQHSEWLYYGSDINQALVNNFICALRGEEMPRVTGEDGLRATQIALAAYESIRTGQVVRL